jgi:hypothetical protein
MAAMARVRIGEILSRMGQLNEHDIDEILQEQSASGHRFGDIALAWGMVEPTHVWRAWCDQLGDGPQMVDLDQIGIDSQATAHLSGDVARRLGIMPVRLLDGELVLAISNPTQAEALEQMHEMFRASLRFVVAHPRKIQEAIDRYYPLPAAKAG